MRASFKYYFLAILVVGFCTCAMAEDSPENKASASVVLNKRGACISFKDTLPFALFQLHGKTWLALPSGTLPKTLPRDHKNVRIRRIGADGGDVCTISTNDQTFPALRRQKGSVEVVVMKKPKNIDLDPQFLDHHILKRQNRQNVEIDFDLKNRVVLTENNDNPGFILMTRRYYTGVRALTDYAEFSLSPPFRVFYCGKASRINLDEQRNYPTFRL